MENYTPITKIPLEAETNKTKTLVIFGEVFDKGYVNGMVEAAKSKNYDVIYSTVGRRYEGELSKLNDEDLKNKPGQSPLINIPLEASFDMLKDEDGNTILDQLKGVKLSEWKSIKLDKNKVKNLREKGLSEFRKRVQQFVSELEGNLSPKGDLIFAHTMAGGVPRAKIIMPLLNKIFKGTGSRFLSSKEFWDSDLGFLCKESFEFVTADTLAVLLEETKELREFYESKGFEVHYTAYGYHGCPSLTPRGDYFWQSYAPYLQGWAKLELENIAKKAQSNNVKVTVYNAPEILTSSSSIFQGIEVCLYPLLFAIEKECDESTYHKVLSVVSSKLNNPEDIQVIKDLTQGNLNTDEVKQKDSWAKWPEHNSPEFAEKTQGLSKKLIDLHKSSKELMTIYLSEIVFKTCGEIMINSSQNNTHPVLWVGHEAVAKQLHNKPSLLPN